MDVEMADLFFKADRQLSASQKSRANELRRSYRQWRVGESSGHADPLDLNHAASVSEERSSAKMKRVKTVGDRVHRLEASVGTGGAASPGPPPAQAPAASGEGISGSAAEQPPAYPQFHESELPPLVAGGGCPFKQGDVADLKPASVPSPQRSPLPPQQLPISATKPITPQDLPSAPSQPTPHSCSPLPPHVATLPSHTPTPPKQQLSSPSPSALIPPVQAATQVQMAAGPSTLSSLSASQPTSQTKAQMAAQSHAQPQVQTLSPAQLAAFQAAYAKALQEQKNLYQKMHPQKPAAGAAPLAGTCVSNSHSQGGMSTGAANAVASSHSLPSPSAGPPLNPPSQGGRGSGGKCRCEPHSKPTSASTSTAAASVFASGRPGGVTEQGESSGVGCVSSPQDDEALASHGVMACSDSDMGAPDATADEDEDGVDGKLKRELAVCDGGGGIRLSMGDGNYGSWHRVWQTALQAANAAIGWGTILPSMMRTWGAIAPPKSDTRWICFPYLTSLPRCTMDLPSVLAERNYSLDVLPDAPQPVPVNVLLPEAIVQRDMKTIGAYPSSSRSSSRSNRKRPKQAQPQSQQHTQPQLQHQLHPPRAGGQGGTPPGGGMSAGPSALPVSESEEAAGKRLKVGDGDQTTFSELESVQPSEEVRLTSSLSVADLITSLGLNRTASMGNVNGRSGMTPSSSMTQLLSVLEAHAPGDSGDNGYPERQASLDGSLPQLQSFNSMSSLLGLLRSNLSSNELHELGHDTSLSDLQTLATFAREASAQDLSELQMRLEQHHEQQHHHTQHAPHAQHAAHTHPHALHQQAEHPHQQQAQSPGAGQQYGAEQPHRPQSLPRTQLHHSQQQQGLPGGHLHSQSHHPQPPHHHQPLAHHVGQHQQRPQPHQDEASKPYGGSLPLHHFSSAGGGYHAAQPHRSSPHQLGAGCLQYPPAHALGQREGGHTAEIWGGGGGQPQTQPQMRREGKEANSSAMKHPMAVAPAAGNEQMSRMQPPHRSSQPEEGKAGVGMEGVVGGMHAPHSVRPTHHSADTSMAHLIPSHHMGALPHRYSPQSQHPTHQPQPSHPPHPPHQQPACAAAGIHGKGGVLCEMAAASSQPSLGAAPAASSGMGQQAGGQPKGGSFGSGEAKEGLPSMAPQPQSMGAPALPPLGHRCSFGMMKESSSVQSLVDLVKSSSATSLVELMHSYSATNLAGLSRDEPVPEF